MSLIGLTFCPLRYVLLKTISYFGGASVGGMLLVERILFDVFEVLVGAYFELVC